MAPKETAERGGAEVAANATAEVEQAKQALSSAAAANWAGLADTVHLSGSIDRTNPFFQTLGTNQRTCETCHAGNQGWTLTADGAKIEFLLSGGQAPLFMTHDAGSRPDADISTFEARLATFGSTTLKRGLIRFTRNISPTAEFFVASVNDPYGFSTTTQVSAFRRPTPTANETKVVSTTWTGGPADPFVSVANTTGGAARLHEQRVDVLPPDVVASARDFQLGVIFAQAYDFLAGRLDAAGAKGGPEALAAQPFYVGINDIQGNDPQGKPFSRKVFDLFDAWAVYNGAPSWDFVAQARASIYRGQELFNNYEFDVTGVTGLNDVLGQSTVRATCSTCHNAPNVGGHSVFRMFDLGTANEPNCSSDLPLVTLQNKTTGETRKVCDMGRATSTGKWADIGGFRAPPLRGLAARAPYFHDGQARDISAVVDYYQARFNMGLSGSQKRDLAAFLKAL